MIIFGPVPSRRLGRSLGINNIPYKACTYSCIYCQLGKTKKLTAEPQQYYDPEQILTMTLDSVDKLQENKEHIDYITFVPDGEPTLDINLGREIELLKGLGIKVAVITNSSLIWRDDVRQRLSKADLVSLKVDSLTEQSWHRINRPHPLLNIDDIKESMISFAKDYRGTIITETMLVGGINDDLEEIKRIGEFLLKLRPKTAYLSIPTRPPAEKWVKSPSPALLAQSFKTLKDSGLFPEYLTEYEGNLFSKRNDLREDLLSITSVHPMREEGVREFLLKNDGDWSLVDELIRDGLIVKKEYDGKIFYRRRFSGNDKKL